MNRCSSKKRTPASHDAAVIRISGKHLGVLSLPGFCERCFWLQMKCGWKMPYSIFPGIFSTIDSHVKKVVGAFYAAHNELPAWLSGMGTPLPIPHWSKFCHTDPHSGLLLVGAPDEMCRRSNNTLAILDYKCARHTDGQDALLPMYRTQLNSYGYLAEKLGLGHTEFLGLVYCEPIAGGLDGDALKICRPDGFDLQSVSKMVPIPVEIETIPPLLARVRDLVAQTVPPPSHPDCRDCVLLNRLLAIAAA